MKTRITITIPPELLEEADRRVRELDRSRSWLLSHALELYLKSELPAELQDAVREPSAVYVPGLGPARQAQLEADLALSPEERVALAEETARVADLRRPGAGEMQRVLAFESLEDFLDWQRREDLVR